MSESDGEGYSSPEAEWTEKEGDNEEDDGVPQLGSPDHEGWRVSEKRGGRRVSDVSGRLKRGGGSRSRTRGPSDGSSR